MALSLKKWRIKMCFVLFQHASSPQFAKNDGVLANCLIRHLPPTHVVCGVADWQSGALSLEKQERNRIVLEGNRPGANERTSVQGTAMGIDATSSRPGRCEDARDRQAPSNAVFRAAGPAVPKSISQGSHPSAENRELLCQN